MAVKRFLASMIGLMNSDIYIIAFDRHGCAQFEIHFVIVRR
jgi:hypothetical protein